MYGKSELQADIKLLINKFEIKSIGRTVLKNDIYMIKAGNGKKKIIIISGHHALESITSRAIMDYLKNKQEDDFGNVSLYIIPLLNVDGTDFHMKRIKNKKFKAMENIWQANYRGIDLNHNYNAGFYTAAAAVRGEGIKSPQHTKYGGIFPFSEPETKAVKRLCRKEKFSLAIAFHTQGEEIYFGYENVYPEDTFFYLSRFEAVTDYISKTPTGTAAHAGFKDWFIKKYKKPAFTIEAGFGKNPLGDDKYENVYQKCSEILDTVLTE